MNIQLQKVPVIVNDDTQFFTEVTDAGRTVLAAFLAPWSVPCRKLASVLDVLASSSYRRVKVLKLNVDDLPDLSACYGIRDIPTLLGFVHGAESFRIVGTASKKLILSKLKQVSPSPNKFNANHQKPNL